MPACLLAGWGRVVFGGAGRLNRRVCVPEAITMKPLDRNLTVENQRCWQVVGVIGNWQVT